MGKKKRTVSPAVCEKWTSPPAVPELRLFEMPLSGRSVWPGQCCPGFAARRSETLKTTPECWFCRHADFHLTQPLALEVGICCYPGTPDSPA